MPLMIKKYLKDSFAELHNVTWPTRKQGVRITVIVFIFMIVSAALLGVIDYLYSWLVQLLLNS